MKQVAVGSTCGRYIIEDLEERTMLSGVKFIPKDQLNTDLDSSTKERKRSGSKKDKDRRKGNSKYDSSSDDEKIKKNSRNKKLYASDESSSSSESEEDSEVDEKKHRNKRRKKFNDEISTDEGRSKLKRGSKRRKKHYSSSTSDREDENDKGRRGSQRIGNKQKVGRDTEAWHDASDDSGESIPPDEKEIARKEAGLDWMLKPDPSRIPEKVDDSPKEPQIEEVKKTNPRELNPYLKDNGSGYPDDIDQKKAGGNQHRTPSSSVVGDGGASWRLKALKRAQEQAAREGRKLEEVVEERWDSLGQLAVSAASRAAPAHAHLHAIKDRRRGVAEKHGPLSEDQNNQNDEKGYGGRREYLKNVSSRNPEMKAPKIDGSLSWRQRKGQEMSKGDSQLICAAASHLNKFANDGSFMRELTDKLEPSEHVKLDLVSSSINKPSEDIPVVKQALTANQLAAKAMQLRMKGKNEEADKLLEEADVIKMKQERQSHLASKASEGVASRFAMKDFSIKQKKKEDDGDMHLAQKIVQNKSYGRPDDEYDYDDSPRKKKNRKRQETNQLTDTSSVGKRILTQQERCQYCFGSTKMPEHLVVSIANFTYLMLPQWQPVTEGHCCILPMQHEFAATRSVDEEVWEELRNFKKCLIVMFRKQNKEVVFLETVMGLAQQRRHCLVECIPVPGEIFNEAPLYFKKAIDEAEDEWSQHNAKKLIDIAEKGGLRRSIPENFPYFFVEFGLDKGFVHVIDDEKQFKSNLGLNVIRGMLRLSEEDMYRRRRYESVETQKAAVASFKQQWKDVDWTKQLR